MDHKVSSSKAKGSAVCFLINTSWCSDVAALASHFSPDLEYLTVKCHPYNLLQEFTSAILIAAYIPPHPYVIYTATNTLETKFPEALFLVAEDFNQTNLKRVLPKYHQHISCPTREPNILDHCYMTIKDAYSYKQKLILHKRKDNAGTAWNWWTGPYSRIRLETEA
eukprot:g34010.t1